MAHSTPTSPKQGYGALEQHNYRIICSIINFIPWHQWIWLIKPPSHKKTLCFCSFQIRPAEPVGWTWDFTKNKKIPRAEGARNFFWGLKTPKNVFFCGAKHVGQTDLNITDFWSARNQLIKKPLYVFAVFLNRGVMSHIHWSNWRRSVGQQQYSVVCVVE